jgi:hypothetical protein
MYNIYSVSESVGVPTTVTTRKRGRQPHWQCISILQVVVLIVFLVLVYIIRPCSIDCVQSVSVHRPCCFHLLLVDESCFFGIVSSSSFHSIPCLFGRPRESADNKTHKIYMSFSCEIESSANNSFHANRKQQTYWQLHLQIAMVTNTNDGSDK